MMALYDDAHLLLMNKMNLYTITATELCCLGLLYKKRDWPGMNYSQALFYLQQASLRHSKEANLALGTWYEKGDYGLAQDKHKAMVCYSRGVASNCLKSTVSLARLLQSNHYLRDKDNPRYFLTLYKLAASRGDQYAIEMCRGYQFLLRK